PRVRGDPYPQGDVYRASRQLRVFAKPLPVVMGPGLATTSRPGTTAVFGARASVSSSPPTSTPVGWAKARKRRAHHLTPRVEVVGTLPLCPPYDSCVCRPLTPSRSWSDPGTSAAPARTA